MADVSTQRDLALLTQVSAQASVAWTEAHQQLTAITTATAVRHHEVVSKYTSHFCSHDCKCCTVNHNLSWSSVTASIPGTRWCLWQISKSAGDISSHSLHWDLYMQPLEGGVSLSPPTLLYVVRCQGRLLHDHQTQTATSTALVTAMDTAAEEASLASWRTADLWEDQVRDPVKVSWIVSPMLAILNRAIAPGISIHDVTDVTLCHIL